MLLARFTCVSVITFLLVAVPAIGGDWHNSATPCSECHTQHNSEEGAPVPNNPAPSSYSLRRATAEELCLSCHDGTDVNAPNVLSSNGIYAAAGGFFTTPITPTTHHLVKTPTAPSAGLQPMVVSCTTCHDPHGNSNYRNLRTNPNPNGGAISGGVVVNQTVRADGTNPSLVYVRTNLVDKQNVSIFCEACHGAPDPVADHPVDRTLSPTAYAIWGCQGAIRRAMCDSPELRTRASSPADDSIPSTDDEVNCLSCHRAHGTQDTTSSLWFADSITIDSTCQECHNQ